MKEPTEKELAMLTATADMVGRTGAIEFQIRYSDDEEPVLWIAYAGYKENRYGVGTATNPFTACIRLMNLLVDGGRCTHCNRMTIYWPEIVPEDSEPPLSDKDCVYYLDEKTMKFKRGCE